jgi:hypothetical protein
MQTVSQAREAGETGSAHDRHGKSAKYGSNAGGIPDASDAVGRWLLKLRRWDYPAVEVVGGSRLPHQLLQSTRYKLGFTIMKAEVGGRGIEAMELGPVHVKRRRWLQDGYLGGCPLRFWGNDRHHGTPAAFSTSDLLADCGPRQAVQSVLGSACDLELSGCSRKVSFLCERLDYFSDSFSPAVEAVISCYHY